jgi:hypothetical protein
MVEDRRSQGVGQLELAFAEGIQPRSCDRAPSLLDGVMRSSDRLVGSPSLRNAEQLHEARFVRIAHGGLAIWLDPFGMLDPEVVVNLLPELGVSVDLVRQGRWLGETFKRRGGRFV